MRDCEYQEGTELEVDFVEYKTPETFREAIKGPDSEKWVTAIEQELQAHKNNEMWTLVQKTDIMRLIDSKWVFKVVTGKTEGYRYKARLCARGFLRQQGIHYNETVAPAVRYDSLRIFLARVTQGDLELGQFDVCMAFLYRELEEEVFMKIPEGLVIEEASGESDVYRLRKSLDGLKKAPKCWNQKFSAIIEKINFVQFDADHCILLGWLSVADVYLALFVDDSRGF